MPPIIFENDEVYLYIKIELIRGELIYTGMQEGFGSQNTIRISQRLDSYLTIYQRLFSKNRRTFLNK
ncbi:Spo0E family sporulation regulatory protein-aspartic acid phosphatase [Robertmurraya sp.]|uniref:Spo0E family sporulation regulatory protein-aspartic acid phosphatase n=1 Tax=Robertmurraya sp. TaxID=2837525 RepID=UPI00370458C9